ncbi:MAG: hypothetical protein M3253_05215 [Chloroflexota bacterium]|nr:hypothetical protein [Chloroflexota bacterium]
MSVTGGRSNDTPRYLRGIAADRDLDLALATRAGRHRQAIALRVWASSTNPDPSHCP